MEQQRCQSIAQVPFDMIGEHAEEDVGSYPVCGPVADRSDLQIDGLHVAEVALDAREVLAGLHRLVGIKPRGRHRGADHVDTVEASIGVDLLGPPPEAEVAVADLDREVVAHLATVDDRHADRCHTALHARSSASRDAPRELVPQRASCLQHSADHRLVHGMSISQLADTRVKTPAAHLANLAAKAAQDTPNAELYIEQLGLQ